MARFRFGWMLIVGATLLGVLPVGAQDAVPQAPPGSPWWGVIVLTVVGLVVELTRRLVIRGIESKVAKEKAAYEALAQKAESEEAERKRRFDLEIARIQGERETENSTARQMEALTTSINGLTQQMGSAYLTLATDRQQAASERVDFRKGLDANTGEITKLVRAVDSLTSSIDRLIRLHETEPELDDAIKHAVEAVTPQVERAAEAVERAVATPPKPEITHAD